ncbi:general secretion pathway protein G [Listeria floridensis FSL S10-1187]|uniref:ComG operon protein 3 n=1 Tax=Listeria floridensis FSL S10-1187 TaxID=1265817 RepID=A0ABN0RF43_9LIST|nr:competence type IV pilus major pilin ComGC [Listeria floridensis]EUJ31769.1 general secretion pathway protein G [Listeria floridensis FSL S10-1187]
MKINWRDERGFTLVEMLVVLLVVSVLLLLIIPNLTKQSKSINDKGCSAFVSMVETQVQAYELEYNKIPTFDDLHAKGFLSDKQKSCPNGNQVAINSDGTVHEK